MNVTLEPVPTVEIDRVLQSETFRSSEVLRRLFRFLADKSIAGESEQLKEYSIGIDALGKPSSFDPRHDAIVRLQASRLRQKLGEYYRTEGKNDPVVIDLPKGSFKLTWHSRPEASVEPALVHNPVVADKSHRGWLIPIMVGSIIILALCNAWLFLSLRSAETKEPAGGMWTPALHELWDPFISSTRSLLLAFPDPVFAGVLNDDGNVVGYLRLDGMRDWREVEKSPTVQAFRRLLGNPRLEARFDLVGRGYLDFVLRLGKLLGGRQPRLSIARLSEVSSEVLSEDNVVFAGGKGLNLEGHLAGLPVKKEFAVVPEGIQNLHPRAGEPAIFADSRPAAVDGEIYAMVSVLPGPVGVTRVCSFESNRFWGNTGAMEWLTDPAFAKFLVAKLKGASKDIPAFYQIVLKVRYKDGIPMEITYITHRAFPALPVTTGEK